MKKRKIVRPDLPALLDAEAAVSTFLDGLRRKDDKLLRKLIYGPTQDQLGVPARSIAAFMLRKWGIDEAELGRLGVVQTARILPGLHGPKGLVGFGMIPGTRTRVVMEPTPARAMALIRAQGTWQIWGTPDPREWADAELVHLPAGEEISDESLSVLAAEWIMAVQPHLAELVGLSQPATASQQLVAPRECAHSIATISMLVFAIESIAGRLVASGRLKGPVPECAIEAMPTASQGDKLAELFVIRNVITHNHVWRVRTRFNRDFELVDFVAAEAVYGDVTRSTYERAVDMSRRRTKRLHIPIVPTQIRRTNVAAVLGAAVPVFDALAAIDVENMRSVADHWVRIGGKIIRLRDIKI